MNILYLAHRIPYPPDKGDKIRSYHQVRYLGERHRVALVCFADDRSDLDGADALREHCASVDVVFRSPGMARVAALRGFLDGRSLSVAAFDSGRLRRAARARARAADVVVAYSSVMAQYVPGEPDVPRLMDFVDVDSDKWRLYAERRRWPASWVFAREAALLGRFEETIARSWSHLLVVSEQEARLLRPHASGRPVTVLRNGVDLEFFRPSDHPVRPATDTVEPSIVFTGVMDYFPNVDGVRYFAQSIFPLIREAMPSARFTIVGRNPTAAVRALARAEGVEVTGAVDDVRPFLARAAVAVAPLRVARGIQNKVLEAMAMGLPVVGTSAAFAGLGATGEAGAEAADEPAGFAAAVVALLRDPERRAEQGRRARAYVERNHRWSEHGAALERLLEQMVHGSAAVL